MQNSIAASPKMPAHIKPHSTWALRPLILDRYILREFALSFVAVMGFCAVMLLVAELFDQVDVIMDNRPPLKTVIGYFATSLPGQLIQIVPIASMLAVLFSVGTLARGNEVLSMMTSGINGLRIAMPVLAGGCLIVLATFVASETIIPRLEEQSRVYELLMENKSTASLVTQKRVFARGQDDWYYMARLFSAKEKRLYNPVVVQLSTEQDRVLQRIEADVASFVSNDRPNRKSMWEFTNLRWWRFDEEGRPTSYHHNAGKEVVPLEADLAKVLTNQSRPEGMSFLELQNRIELLEARNQRVNALQTDLLHKITFPLGVLIIMMIGFSYAVRTRAGTMMTVFGYGISWAVGYYLINAILQAMGHSGSISPFAATIFPTIVFAVFAAVYMRRSSRWYA